MNKKEKLHNIEFLRIIFAIVIVYFHILHANILNYVDDNGIYFMLQKLSDNASLIVECFFIISGYFLFISYRNNKNISIEQFILKKILRLGPVLWFSIILGVIFFSQKITPSVFNALFLQCIGISIEYKGINWYISPLFWVTIFYYAILKIFDSQKSNFIISVLVYVSFVILVNQGFGRETVYGFVNLAVMRALAGIGLGYLIGNMLEVIDNLNFQYDVKKKALVKWFKLVVASIVEILAFIYLAQYFLLGKKYCDHFIIVIVFSILFCCFIRREGLISKTLNNEIFSQWGGRYAYSIYVMQQISFWILQRTLWKTDIVNSVGLCIVSSLLFCIIVGIATYYAVELPCFKLYKKMGFKERF